MIALDCGEKQQELYMAPAVFFSKKCLAGTIDNISRIRRNLSEMAREKGKFFLR